jgi:predicted Zn finger-like uncharacterized protein
VSVECPNCAARYRLSEAVLAKGARLKCAACQHRWVPAAPPASVLQSLSEAAAAMQTPAAPPPRPKPRPKPLTEADEEAEFAAVQEQLLSRWAEPAPGSTPTAAPEPEPVTMTADPDAGDEPEEPSSGFARSVVAGIAGLALAVIAGGLWLGRTDLGSVPVVGEALTRLEAHSPLTLEVKGSVTQLPSSRRVLEVTGTIRNPSDAPATVAPLEASLSGPTGVALRWSIPAPVAVLPPRQQVDYSSTVTGFPAEAQTLTVSLGR